MRPTREGYVTTQGHVLRVPDLLATLTTEAVVHHLDLVLDLPDAPPARGARRRGSRSPPWTACSATTPSGPARGSDRTYLLKATGRLPLTDRDRLELGEVAGWFPLLG